MSSDIVEADNQFLLSAREVILLPNSSDDIVETVDEALQPDSYSIQNEEVGRSILERLKNLNAEHGTEISGRLGRYFATKYAAKLGATNS